MDPIPSITSQVQNLAHWIWQQRGQPVDSSEDNWFLAEALLQRQYEQLSASLGETSLFAFGLERRTS